MADSSIVNMYERAINHFDRVINKPPNDKMSRMTHLATGLELFCGAIQGLRDHPDPLYNMAINHFWRAAHVADSQEIQLGHIATGLQQFCAASKNDLVGRP